MVNSITHLWGSRRFATRDLSTNNFWIAMVTFGEGWHNNHHAHPTSARHGLAWYEFDPSWLQLKVLSALGIAKSIQVAKIPTEQQQREAA
jgi:stearoyl-CoA desaturase (delta-9 desaturase)